MTPLADSLWKQQLRRRLLAWYPRVARDLAWRRTDDPYAIWVSEIMLQQTQVATVGPYFERFLAAFPTIEALAVADEQDVLRLWEGLGYYRRARQLHRAAQVLVVEYRGRFPRQVDEILKLPGIGRYTAGAIASIAFDARAPILEANTMRVYCRLLAYGEDPTRSAGQRLLWQFAAEILPRRQTGRFNQAMMELGSLVCTPTSPDCPNCPLAALCPTHRQGLQDSIPRNRPRPQIEQVHEATVVVQRRGAVLLVRRGENERWAGLWDFPRFGIDPQQPKSLARQLSAGVRQAAAVDVEPGGLLTTLRHGVTRFRITLDCYRARYLRRVEHLRAPESQWVLPDDLGDFPLSVTGRKLARLLAERLPDTTAGRRSDSPLAVR